MSSITSFSSSSCNSQATHDRSSATSSSKKREREYGSTIEKSKEVEPKKIARAKTMKQEEYSMPSSIACIESLLKYKFKNPKLCEEALTHSSNTDHVPYQTLEFVGDSALGLAITNYLFLKHRDVGPGGLSTLRAANISTEKLARIAVKHNLYDLVRKNSPKLDKMGRFKYQPGQIKAYEVLARGSGITLIFQITRVILENPSDKKNVHLIYANITLNDILLKEELDGLPGNYPGHFNVYYVLNQPHEVWTGEVRFVSK